MSQFQKKKPTTATKNDKKQFHDKIKVSKRVKFSFSFVFFFCESFTG